MKTNYPGPAGSARSADERWSAGVLLGPATALVLVVLVVPLAILLRFSFNAFVPGKFMVEALTPANYVKFFTDPYYGNVMLLTVTVATIVTVVCLVVGFPVAWFLARLRSRWKSFLILLVILPLFVGNAVRAAGWMVVFGKQGFLNTVLLWTGLSSVPLEIMYTSTAVVIGMTAVNLPYMVLTLQSVLEGVDRSLEEAALGLGAGPFETFRRVTLPLALPGIITGTTLSFILGMNAYATPVLLGGPRFQMMAPLVYNQIASQANWPFGSALAFILMAVTLALTVASNLIVQRRYRR